MEDHQMTPGELAAHDQATAIVRDHVLQMASDFQQAVRLYGIHPARAALLHGLEQGGSVMQMSVALMAIQLLSERLP